MCGVMPRGRVPCMDMCWASGKLKHWVTGAVDNVTLEMDKNHLSARYMSCHERNACGNLLTETFRVKLDFSELFL
jgi:hypothetical protein